MFLWNCSNTFKKKISPSNSWLFQSSFPPETVEMRDTGLQILLFPSKLTLFPARWVSRYQIYLLSETTKIPVSFQNSWHQTANNSDPWDSRNKWGEPYNWPSFLPREHFQIPALGRSIQVEPSGLSEFIRWSIREDRAAQRELWTLQRDCLRY